MYASFINWYTFTIRTFKHNSDLSLSQSLQLLPAMKSMSILYMTTAARSQSTTSNGMCLFVIGVIVLSYTTDNWQCKHNSDHSPDLFIYHQILPAKKSMSVPYMTTAARGQSMTSNGTCLFIIGVIHNRQLTTPPQPNLPVIQDIPEHRILPPFPPQPSLNSPVSTPIIMHDLYLVCRLSLARNSPLVPRNDVSLLYFISFSFTNLFLDD